MKHVAGLFFLLFLPCGVISRGPHHPRGEKVAKHYHHTPRKDGEEKITHDEELLHDRQHIQEHLDEQMMGPDTSKMTDEELEFYYFQVHDTDRNSKLDGLEILQAILHTADHSDESGLNNNEFRNGTDDASNNGVKSDFDYYVALIDRVLQEDDFDKDGYLDYVEYSQGKKKTNLPNADIPVVQMMP